MPKSPLADDVLQRGFDLAYFIHGDKASALRIVTEAAEKLDVSMASQDKRLYYQPKVDHFRTKVSLSRLHLFQRLIYIVSEKHEKEWESRNRADQSAMVVRFIKHLVRITWKRNSFYVALGVLLLPFAKVDSDARARRSIRRLASRLSGTARRRTVPVRRLSLSLCTSGQTITRNVYSLGHSLSGCGARADAHRSSRILRLERQQLGR